jgi:hypothetical protein
MLQHNRAKTPEGRAAQDKRSRTQIANGLIWEGSGLIFGRVVRGIKLFEPRHIEIGGYGRYPNTDNYTLSPVDYDGNPIPNLSQGRAELNLKNVPSNSVDIVTIENAPFYDAIMTETNRVLKSKGTLEITTNSEVVSPETFPDIAKRYNLILKEIKKTTMPDANGGTYEQQTAIFTKPSMAK